MNHLEAIELGWLVEAAEGLGVDELRILAVIAGRLQHGRKQYGAWVLVSDKRDWAKEAGEEMADALVYLAAKQLTEREK